MFVIGSDLNIYQITGISLLFVVFGMQIQKIYNKMKDDEAKKLKE